MALIALKNIDNVIRIQTDSISYDKSIDINEYLFIEETDKSDNKAEVRGISLLKL